MKKEGLALSIDYHYLQVHFGIDGIQEDPRAVRALFKSLSLRLWASSDDSEEGGWTERGLAVIKEIHASIQEQDIETICFPEAPYDEGLAVYDLTKDSLKSMEYEHFE